MRIRLFTWSKAFVAASVSSASLLNTSVAARLLSTNCEQSKPADEHATKRARWTHVHNDCPLSYTLDAYNGVNVTGVPGDVSAFERDLDNSMTIWRRDSRRGVWMKIPIEKSEFIKVAVSRGFVFHHAQPSHVVMNAWLPSSVNQLPPYASHQVGVGCVVLVEPKPKPVPAPKNHHQDPATPDVKILCVQERRGPLRGEDFWKMPTGLVLRGEDIAMAAEREVLEETGVKAKFDRVLAIRHMHNALFDNSDLFFVCQLKPEAHDGDGQHDDADDSALPKIHVQTSELADSQWRSLNEYVAQARFQSSPLYASINQVISAAASSAGDHDGMAAAQVAVGAAHFN